jgi:hypothetical protein
MRSIRQTILEMAKPTDRQSSRVYFHGTSSEAAGKSILEKGVIEPPEITKKGMLVPVKGKVYITPHIHYAQIYGIGGDMAGSTGWNPEERGHDRYGYVFGIKGHRLKDIQPDEDDVGEMVSKQAHPWLVHNAPKILTPNQLRGVKDGWYAHWAAAGKKLVKVMPDYVKHDLIDAGAHVAHDGPLEIDHAWRIDKRKIPLLKRDGSNFFDHAEPIPLSHHTA